MRSIDLLFARSLYGILIFRLSAVSGYHNDNVKPGIAYHDVGYKVRLD
jgi:hypothetical protein